jgi:acyl-CoA thioesterase-1
VITRWILFHVASGHSFFSGSACLLAAIGLSPIVHNRWARTSRNLLAALGGILVAVSATPLPPALYLSLLLALLLWAFAESSRARLPPRVTGSVRAGASLLVAVMVALEYPHHVPPRIPPLGRPVLGILGDSVTAGMGGPRGANWPGHLANRHALTVRDHSQMGATVSSALKQAAAIAPDERLVLLEIGGNDLLGGTSLEAFQTGLNRLLSAVCQPGRSVVMLELPLPPGYNRYGIIQRRLARRYHVRLVPKHVLLAVLMRGGATLDSIHLSQEGHRQMAQAIWIVIRGAYDRAT